MRKNATMLILTLFVFISYSGFMVLDAPACTIAVVSGSATPDGRPLLWKNRDKSSWVNNEVKFFTDLSHISNGYIGIVDADGYGSGSENTHVWSGVNDNGFAICNSYVSPNPGYQSGNNGPFMKAALMNCATVDKFESFLASWTQGKLSANFGVIDAEGGAAMFEVQALVGQIPEYIRTDAHTEPHHYIVMANYNTYGGGSTGQERKEQAEELFEKAYSNNDLSHRFILRYVARDLMTVPSNPGQYDEYPTTSCINRYRTRSCTVAHGVKFPEDPHYSTLWTFLGEPAFSAAVPLFSYAHSVPFEMTAPFNDMAPMNYIIQDRELRSYTDNYYDTTIRPWPLWNPENGSPPIQKYAFAIEDYTFKKTEEMIEWWKSIKRIKIPEDFRDFENYTCKNIYKCYHQEMFFEWKYDIP